MKQIKNVVLLLFVSVLLISCSMKSISYKIINGYGRWASQIAKTRENYEIIKNKGNGVYIEFDDICSTTNQPISIHVFSINDFNTIEFTDLVFVIEDKIFKTSINKTFSVKTEKFDFEVEEAPELKLSGYDYVLWRNESKIKVNLKKVFAGLDLSPGNQYEMSLMVNYSLDDTPYMQEINYKVVPYETKGSSEWIYRLFPETGI
ncbi:MAG: hypothetical protein J6Y60_08470 [Treponema sp.]|nr:hypothetical protein [Treponema sp.]